MRYVLSMGVNGDGWNAAWNLRHSSESDDVWRHPSVTSDAVAEATTYHDVVTSFDYGVAVVRFGINNLTDESPPYFHSNFNGNTEPGVYDVIGRRMFISMTATF